MRDEMKILVVDDDPNVLLTSSELIKEEGYEVLTASSGKETLKVVGKDHPDLVLLDVALPDADGTEVCRRIKADPTPRVPLVVLLSDVRTSYESRTEGLEAGADDYILRPIPDREFLARVQSLVRLKQAEEALQTVRDGSKRQKRTEEAVQCNIREVTEWKQAEEALRGDHDGLDLAIKERTADLAIADEQLYKEIERRKQTEESLEERLRFEMLLAKTSARFVSLPAIEIDGEIESAQRRVCALLGLDRSALWQVAEGEPGTMMLTHIHQPPGGSLPPKRPNARDLFPWSAQKVLAGETVTISKMTDLPAEAGRDRESYGLYGTKSTLLVPLSVGGGPIFGVLTFAVMRGARDWPETVVKGLQLIAQVFANALARKRADETLRESEARLSLATSAAGMGLWIMEPETGHVWVTPKTRELFHFAPDEELNDESFFQVICPEDRERARQAVQRTLQSGENLLSDYRIVHSDGSIRWISACGQRYLRSTGEPVRVMGVCLDITERKRTENQLKEHLQEIEELKLRLEKENIYLQEEVKLLVEHTEIVGQSLSMKRVLSQAEQVARTDSTALIQGETGTGKELLARAIHRMSARKDRPLITVNCASLPPTLIESELFGREKGAYTGAMTKMIGRFEIADGSTLFLDEIGELPLELQSKLLRVLEEGNFERLGSTKPLHVNVRIIAATNRDIEQEVKDGKFRKDLFYRLNVFPILIPPLRERPEDIPLMFWAFVREFQQRMGKEIETISKKSMEALQSYSWPGNVRELRNVIEHAMILSKSKTLVVHVPKLRSSEAGVARSLEEMERRHIVSVLEKAGWRVAGKGGAAEVLGLKRSTLISKMKKLHIHRPAS
jgi:formate hydrogenlyase transcriptional activator